MSRRFPPLSGRHFPDRAFGPNSVNLQLASSSHQDSTFNVQRPTFNVQRNVQRRYQKNDTRCFGGHTTQPLFHIRTLGLLSFLHSFGTLCGTDETRRNKLTVLVNVRGDFSAFFKVERLNVCWLAWEK